LESSGGKEMLAGFCWGHMEERGCLEDRGVEGRIICNLVIKKY
jgi:hypothetical protein